MLGSSRVIATNIDESLPFYLLDDYRKELVAEIKRIEKIGDKLALVLDDTIFYPGGGHQPHDTGRVIINGREFLINKVEKRENTILHYLNEFTDTTKLPVGSKVKLMIDWERRYRIMKLHTAEHIFMECIRKEGYDLENGQWGPDKGLIVFNEEIPPETLFKCEAGTNKIIRKDLSVYRVINRNYITIKIDEYSERPCGGTHVSRTGEIGFFKIISILKRGKAVYFNVGNEAIDSIIKDYNDLLSIAINTLNLRQEIDLRKVNKMILDTVKDFSGIRNQNEKLSRMLIKIIIQLPYREVKIGEHVFKAHYLDLTDLEVQPKHLKRIGQLISSGEKEEFVIFKLSEESVALIFKRSKKLFKKLRKELRRITKNESTKVQVSSIEGGLVIKSMNQNIDSIIKLIQTS